MSTSQLLAAHIHSSQFPKSFIVSIFLRELAWVSDIPGGILYLNTHALLQQLSCGGWILLPQVDHPIYHDLPPLKRLRPEWLEHAPPWRQRGFEEEYAVRITSATWNYFLKFTSLRVEFSSWTNLHKKAHRMCQPTFRWLLIKNGSFVEVYVQLSRGLWNLLAHCVFVLWAVLAAYVHSTKTQCSSSF